MKRFRKFRQTQSVRDRVSETRLLIDELVMPYFVVEGKNKKIPIRSMPGISRLSIDKLIPEAREISRLGIKSILLFGIPSRKDQGGSPAYAPNGVVQQAIKKIKAAVPKLQVITDVCLCSYTTSGHCEVGTNDATIKILAKVAVSHAAAGAEIVAPSAMMDGQVGAIRRALDKNGFKKTRIMGYSAKYASNFYGPFREAAESTPQSGDRRSYQMDFRNSDEALREVAADIEEGADIVMVKPALAYLDIIRRVKDRFKKVPVAAYNVSGEYSLVKAAAQRGWVDGEKLTLEILTAIKRAGAEIIITYHAKEIAQGGKKWG